jgi:hypothetical protein
MNLYNCGSIFNNLIPAVGNFPNPALALNLKYY